MGKEMLKFCTAQWRNNMKPFVMSDDEDDDWDDDGDDDSEDEDSDSDDEGFDE